MKEIPFTSFPSKSLGTRERENPTWYLVASNSIVSIEGTPLPSFPSSCLGRKCAGLTEMKLSF